MTQEDAFVKFTTIKGIEDGGWEVSCNKGLWSVYAPTLRRAMEEATHYFKQYYGDGGSRVGITRILVPSSRKDNS